MQWYVHSVHFLLQLLFTVREIASSFRHNCRSRNLWIHALFSMILLPMGVIAMSGYGMGAPRNPRSRNRVRPTSMTYLEESRILVCLFVIFFVAECQHCYVQWSSIEASEYGDASSPFWVSVCRRSLFILQQPPNAIGVSSGPFFSSVVSWITRTNEVE